MPVDVLLNNEPPALKVDPNPKPVDFPVPPNDKLRVRPEAAGFEKAEPNPIVFDKPIVLAEGKKRNRVEKLPLKIDFK